MKSSKQIILLIATLMLFALACSISDGAADKVNEAVDSAATQVVEQVTTAVPDAGTAIAEVEKAATEVADQPTATEVAEQPAATDTLEPANNDSTADETEETAIDLTSLTSSLDQFDSYKSTTEVSYEGTDVDGNPTTGSILFVSEEIKDPYASHILMSFEGDIADDLGSTTSDGAVSMEMYNVDGVSYMENPEDGTWMSFPNSGDEDTFGSLLSADDFADLPDFAHKSLLPQTVNGISCWHYTFTEKDMPLEERTDIESAEGEIWIARDGDFPVKYLFSIKGNDLMGDGSVKDGTLHMKYELADINSVKNIVVPDDVKNAASSLGDIMGGDDTSADTGETDSGLADIDMPMMDDADVQFTMDGMASYTTQASIEDIVEFYKDKMSSEGWTYDDNASYIDETIAWIGFTKDGLTFDVIVDAEDEDHVVTLAATNGNQ